MKNGRSILDGLTKSSIQKTAEIFFGKMVLTESAVTKGFCPNCSPEMEGGWRKMKAPA
jgi:hypothetical protein